MDNLLNMFLSVFLVLLTEIQYIYMMDEVKEIRLDFEIDRLTNSIENVNSGDNFPTEIVLLNKSEL